MGFTDICLTENTNDNYGFLQARKTPRNQIRELYLCFRTDIGPNDGYSSFDISLSFSTIAKGKTETSGYGAVSRNYYERFPESRFSAHPVDNRWIWYLPLDIENCKLDMVNSGSYSYTNRRFDAIKMLVGIDRVDNNNEKLNIRTEQTLYIYYGPAYTITGALVTASGLVLKYDVTPDWQRTDDYAHIQKLNTFITSGSSKNNLITTGATKGIFEGNNRLRIPYTIPGIPQNAILSGFIYISPDYDAARVVNVWKTDLNNIKVVNATKCNPISVKMAVDNNIGAASFTISEIKSGYSDVEKVVIRMEPSDFSLDTMVVSTVKNTYNSNGEVTGHTTLLPLTETLYYLPFNKQVKVTLQPFGAEDSTNNIVNFTVRITKNLISLTSIKDGSNVDIRYNYLPNWSSKPDVNLVKLAGRERQSAYYGTGGSVDGTLAGTIIEKNVDPKIVVQNSKDFEEMSFVGDCILRTPDGDRRWISITDVSITPKQLGMSFWKDISIGFTEVR